MSGGYVVPPKPPGSAGRPESFMDYACSNLLHAAAIVALLLWSGACATRGPRRPEPEPSRPSTEKPVVAPEALPLDSAPSGILFRVGLRSDLSEFLYGPPGARWTIVAAGKAQTVRGPLRFRPEAAGGRGFQVQAGAFSGEETAKSRLDRLASQFETPGAVAFSAERGVYRVLLGRFAARSEAEALVERLRASGEEALVVEGAAPAAIAAPAFITVTGQEGGVSRLPSPADVYPAENEGRIELDGRTYRGSLRVLVNPRGTLTLVNRVDLEEYLYGVVPAELGPKRYDAVEALKAQAVAARTYALAHLGQFEAEGYDLCATAKCQVYAGRLAEDPLSNAAVEATRGLALAFDGRFANALFVSTCGGRTENVENVFGETPAPYLVSVECGELQTTGISGARVARASSRPRRGLEWRGYVLGRHAPKKKASRAATLAVAQEWAGVASGGATPRVLAPFAVYPSIVSAFDLTDARLLHLLPRDESYYSEPPSASGKLARSAREAYDFLLRFRFGAGETLPPPERNLTEEEYGGLLFSAVLRLLGATEASGKFLSREGSHIWVKTPEGRTDIPLDAELPLARRVGDFYFPVSTLTLRAGDRLRWWKNGSKVLAMWVELDPVGPAFERESAWTEWVRRVSGKELARRMAARVSGSEVREIAVTKRSAAGRAIEIQVKTDTSEATFKRFDLRQALELPEMLFTVARARGPQGEIEFLFLGRGWGHGVGLCQVGSYGMALAGATYDEILRHYYTGVDIVPASSVSAAPSSAR